MFERELTTRRKQASANGDKSVTVRESLPIRQNRFKLRFMPIALADHEPTKVLSITLLRYLLVVTAKGRREDEPLNRKSEAAGFGLKGCNLPMQLWNIALTQRKRTSIDETGRDG